MKIQKMKIFNEKICGKTEKNEAKLLYQPVFASVHGSVSARPPAPPPAARAFEWLR